MKLANVIQEKLSYNIRGHFLVETWHDSIILRNSNLQPMSIDSNGELHLSHLRKSISMTSVNLPNESEPSPTLLSIPREIRDQIYIAFLQLPDLPPKSPTSVEERIAMPQNGGRDKCIFIRSPRHPVPACDSLLECNKQIRNEVLDILRSGSTDLDYALDIMSKGDRLWPTWTLFPCLPTRIANLNVHLRIFQNKSYGGTFWGDGGPGSIFTPLFQLLNGFFHHGPGFSYKKQTIPDVHVKMLRLTISHAVEQDQGEAAPPPKVWKRVFHSVVSNLYMVAHAGALTGKVDKLMVLSGDREKEVHGGDHELSRETAQYWADYGYVWGPDPEFVQEESA